MRFIVILVSGLWLWWPGWRRVKTALKIHWGGGRTRIAYDLHRVTGFISFPLLMLSAITGVMLVFHKLTATLLLAVFGGSGQPALAPTVEPGVHTQRLSWTVLLARAEEAMPDAETTWISFPANAASAFLARKREPSDSHPNGTSYVAVDPYRGDVLLVHGVFKCLARIISVSVVPKLPRCEKPRVVIASARLHREPER